MHMGAEVYSEQAREIARYQEELKDPSISEERREDLER